MFESTLKRWKIDIRYIKYIKIEFNVKENVCDLHFVHLHNSTTKYSFPN